MKSLFVMLWQSRSAALDIIVMDESPEARSVGFKLNLGLFRLVVVTGSALFLTCIATLGVVLSASRLDPSLAPGAEEGTVGRIVALEDSLRLQQGYLEQLRSLLLGLPEGDILTPAASPSPRVSRLGNAVFPVQPPVRGILTREFVAQSHIGVDVAGTLQSSVQTVLPGVVQLAGWTHDGGHTVIVRHPDGFSSVYKHLNRILVREGQQVSAREPIGLLGSTGVTSTAPHLHFELWHDLTPVNPVHYIAGWSP